MKRTLAHIKTGKTPFCIIQKQDSEDVLLVTGKNSSSRKIIDIPRKLGSTDGRSIYDTISIVPFCQIRERGYRVIDNGEKILTITIKTQQEIDIQSLLNALPSDEIHLAKNITYDQGEEDYCNMIKEIIDNEIGNGEGANFVVPRNAKGLLHDFSVSKALTIFKSLLTNDYGAYWKFIFYDTTRFFIGSTPERHLQVQDGKVKMNPISGTFRKDKNWKRRKDFKKDLLSFLTDQKEINELFMVVDEELKMMANMCDQGGVIIGPLLKEMSQLIHSEYLLAGQSDKDIFELFSHSMFAATVVGSPIENACDIIAKYTLTSRRYYGSALLLVGRDHNGRDFLDSPITIRTVEINPAGELHIGVGATLVRNSEPKEELLETHAKAAALISSIVNTKKSSHNPALLPTLSNDDEVIETLAQRNQTLSSFWFYQQKYNSLKTQAFENREITLIHNQDDFIFMLQHMFNCLGMDTKVISHNDYKLHLDTSDITLLGPGPGNPNDLHIDKIRRNMQITNELLQAGKKALFICLGHQVLCKKLGYELIGKKHPLQGVQKEIELFGKKELVGFYNTFAAKVSPHIMDRDLETSTELDEIVAIRGKHFIGYQFHPESILTQNGLTLLEQAVMHLQEETENCC